jgi:transketolase
VEKITQLDLRLKTERIDIKPWLDSVLKSTSLILFERKKAADLSHLPDPATVDRYQFRHKEDVLPNPELDLVKQVFEPWLVEAGHRNKKIVSLSGDVAPSVGMTEFKNKFGRFSGEKPNGRYLSLPIAERATVEIAEGLAQEGYFGMYEIFVEFALADVIAMLKSQIRFIWIVTHAGLSNADGQAYQSMSASALVRNLPGIVMVEPTTPFETLILLNSIMEEYHTGSQMGYYVRLSKQPVSNISGVSQNDILRGFYELQKTKEPKVIIITMGVIAHEALKAKMLLLEKGVQVRVIVINNLQNWSRRAMPFLP